jgi:hypothetical protein
VDVKLESPSASSVGGLASTLVEEGKIPTILQRNMIVLRIGQLVINRASSGLALTTGGAPLSESLGIFVNKFLNRSGAVIPSEEIGMITRELLGLVGRLHLGGSITALNSNLLNFLRMFPPVFATSLFDYLRSLNFFGISASLAPQLPSFYPNLSRGAGAGPGNITNIQGPELSTTPTSERSPITPSLQLPSAQQYLGTSSISSIPTPSTSPTPATIPLSTTTPSQLTAFSDVHATISSGSVAQHVRTVNGQATNLVLPSVLAVMTAPLSFSALSSRNSLEDVAQRYEVCDIYFLYYFIYFFFGVVMVGVSIVLSVCVFTC